MSRGLGKSREGKSKAKKQLEATGPNRKFEKKSCRCWSEQFNELAGALIAFEEAKGTAQRNHPRINTSFNINIKDRESEKQ